VGGRCNDVHSRFNARGRGGTRGKVAGCETAGGGTSRWDRWNSKTAARPLLCTTRVGSSVQCVACRPHYRARVTNERFDEHDVTSDRAAPETTGRVLAVVADARQDARTNERDRHDKSPVFAFYRRDRIMYYSNGIVVLATVFAAVATTSLQPATAERQTAFARRRTHQQQRRQLMAADAVSPRRQWRHAQAGRAAGEHVLSLRQRHLLTSTASPYKGHYRALHNKLELQTMWPGTSRYPDEAYLPFTTVSTATLYFPTVRENHATHSSIRIIVLSLSARFGRYRNRIQLVCNAYTVLCGFFPQLFSETHRNDVHS